MSKDLLRIKPRHREIMRRLMLGHTQRQIALDMGLDEANLSTVVNAPLFQQELQRLEKDKEERFLKLQEGIARTAEKALEVHEQIVDNKELPAGIRQRSATDVLNIYWGKVVKQRPQEGDGESIPYEKRLRITIEASQRGQEPEKQDYTDDEIGELIEVEEAVALAEGSI